MKILIPTVFRAKYTAATQWATGKYQRALRAGGLDDTEATRVTAAVCVCVFLWYIVALLQYVWSAVANANTITALVVQ